MVIPAPPFYFAAYLAKAACLYGPKVSNLSFLHVEGR